MSQFPLEGGQAPAARLRQGRGNMLDQLGINQRVDAPGLVPTPMTTTPTARLAQQLGQALGVVGDFADAGRSLINQDTARIRREQADAEERAREAARALKEKEREIEQAQRGLATVNSRSWLPELERQITSGELATPQVSETDTRPMTDEAFADQLISQQVEGFSPAYAEQYTSIAKPQIMQALAARRAGRVSQAIEDQQAMLVAGVSSAGTAAELEQSVSFLRSNNKDLSELGAKALVVERAITDAVASKDFDKLDVVAKFADEDVYGSALTRARNEIQTAKQQERSKLRQQTMDRLEMRIGQGQAVEAVYADALAAAERGDLDGNDLLSIRSRLDSIDRDREQKAAKERDRAFIEAGRSRVMQDAASLMMSGGSTLGAAAIPETIKIEAPGGDKETITKKEIVDTVTNQRFAAIDAEIPPGTPSNFDAKVDFLARQGGEAAYAPWKATLNSVASQVSRGDLTPESVPPVALEAFQLYRELGARRTAMGVLNAHVTDDNSRNFLRVADLIYRNARSDTKPGGFDGLTARQAIAQAAAISPEDIQSRAARSSIASSVLDKKAKAFASELGASNVETIRQAIGEKAEYYKMVSGLDDDATLERAMADVSEDMTVIEGRAVFTRGRNLPSQTEQLMSTVKEAIGKASARTFVDPMSGLVTLRGEGGEPIEGGLVLSPDDLQAIARYMNGIDAARERISLLKRDEIARIASKAKGPVTDKPDVTSGGVVLGYLLDDLFGKPHVPAGAEKMMSRAREIPPNVSSELRPVFEFIRDRGTWQERDSAEAIRIRNEALAARMDEVVR